MIGSSFSFYFSFPFSLCISTPFSSISIQPLKIYLKIMKGIYWLILSCLVLFTFTVCAEEEKPETNFKYTPDEAAEEYEIAPEQLTFWENLQEHCGNAYEGKLADATPYYESFDADEIIINFRECTDTLTHISLHLDDDHSRNLLITKQPGTLQLKHDHRHDDGTEDEITQYGGLANSPGLETRQIFYADDHTAEILPMREDNFWFIDLMNDETLAYGVHWPKQGHSIRMEFDISQPVKPPPTPWGY